MSRISKKKTVRQRVKRQETAAAKVSRESPCGRKPVAPGTPTVFWMVEEAKQRLLFRIGAEVGSYTEEDIDGFPTTIDRFEFQAKAVNSSGVSQVNRSGKPVLRKQEVEKPSTDSEDALRVDLGRAQRPKTWYWQVRIRAKDQKGCWSEWSDWSEAALPSTADSEPKPPAPTFVSMDFQTTGGGKANKHRLAVTFTPVRNWDVPGGDTEDDLSKYVCRLEVQSGGAGSWIKHASKIVADKDDGEANEDITVVFGRIRRGDKYRVKLRSIDRFNRRGDWGGPYPTSSGTSKDATADKPDALASVAGESLGPRRVEFDWEDSTDAEFDRYRVVVQAATSSGGSYSTVKTVKGKQSRYRYVVPKADYDAGKLYYKATVYVQSEPDAAGNRVESSGTTSSVVSLAADEAGGGGATQAPDTPATPTAKRRLKAVLLEWDDDQPDAAETVVYEVHAKLSSAAWPTPAKSARVGQTKGSSFLVGRYWNGSALVDFVKGDYANTYNFKLRAKSKIGDTITYATSDSGTVNSKPARGGKRLVGDGGNPAAVTGLTRTKVAPRRIEWTWTESVDADVDRYRVEILRSDTASGATTAYKTAYTRAAHYRLAIPEGDKAKYFRAAVYAETEPDDANVRQSSTATSDANGDISDAVVADSATTATTANGLAAGAIGNLTPFASAIRPIAVGSGTPGTGTAGYGTAGSYYYDASGNALYKYESALGWQKAVGQNDIQANSIKAGMIQAGIITTTELNVANVTVQNLQTPGGGGRIAITSSVGTDRLVFGYGSNFIQGVRMVVDNSGNVDVSGGTANVYRISFSNVALAIPMTSGSGDRSIPGCIWINGGTDNIMRYRHNTGVAKVSTALIAG